MSQVSVSMHPRMRLSNGIAGALIFTLGPFIIYGGQTLWKLRSGINPSDFAYNNVLLLSMGIFLVLVGVFLIGLGLHLVNQPFRKIILDDHYIRLKRTIYPRKICYDDPKKISLLVEETAWHEDFEIIHNRIIDLSLSTETANYHLKINYVRRNDVKDMLDIFREKYGNDPFENSHITATDVIDNTENSIQINRKENRYVWTIHQ